MSGLIKLDKEYQNWLIEVSNRFRRSQIKASIKVNSEMLHFYFGLGKDISSMTSNAKNTADILVKISCDLQKILPNVHIFSKTNLWYMLKFYELYAPIIKNPQLGERQMMQNTEIPQLGDFSNEIIFSIPWGHTKLIIDKCRTNIEKALFYIKKTIENNWSRAILLNFLDTNLYERQGKAVTNFMMLLFLI